MKKYISVLAIIFIISLAACSNQTISSTPTGNESNIQSNSITTLDKGIWPVNEYTEGLPIPPGTVAWATLDTEHENTDFFARTKAGTAASPEIFGEWHRRTCQRIRHRAELQHD